MELTNKFIKPIKEKIVYNRILCPKFWTNGQFNQEVRTKLLQVANDFYSDLKIKVPIIDIHLTGSMANYTWTESSDLDVHVHVDFSLIDENVELVNQAMQGQKFVWNLRHPVNISGHDVELYIQDKNTHTISSGIYSLLKDEWVSKPRYEPPSIDMRYVAGKVEAYKSEIEELEKLIREDESDDARLIFDRAKVLKKKISGSRDESLRKTGEFSIENLVFKELRSQGYIGKLIKLQARAYSAIYSDKDFEPDQTLIMQEKEKPVTEIKNSELNMIEDIKPFNAWRETRIVTENREAANAFMKRMYASRSKRGPNDLSQEEIQKALSNPDYLKILEIVKDHPGYTSAFVKFHFLQGIGLADLKNLNKTLTDKKLIIQQLTTPVEKYASTKEINGVSGFEALHDEIRSIEREKEAKWLIDRLPKLLKNQYRQLTKAEQASLVTAAHQLVELGQGVTDRLLQKIKALESMPISEVIQYIQNFIKGYASTELKKKLDEIANLEPEAGVLYMDDYLLAVSVRTERAQTQLFNVANWCLNRGSFSHYVANAVQINIFDTKEDPGSPLFVIGSTVNYQGEVTNSHDLNDSNLFSHYESGYSSNERFAASNALASRPIKQGYPRIPLKNHLENLGYPKVLIDSVVSQFYTEVIVKKIVYDLGLDNKSITAVVGKIIQDSYNIEASASTEALDIILDLIRTRIVNNMTKEQVIKLYSERGVCSKFSMYLLKELLPNPSPEELEPIVNKTISIFKLIRKLLKTQSSIIKAASIQNTLPQQKEILKELGVTEDQIQSIMESLTPTCQSFILRELGLPVVEVTAIMEVLTMGVEAPVKTPTRTPTKPMTPSRPSPIPTKRPFKIPEPAKAEAEDVIKRLIALTNE